MSLEFPSGKRVNVRLIGIYDKPNGGSPFGDATISTTLFDRYIPRPRDEMVLVNTPDGVSAANTQTLEDDVSGFADAKVQTRDEFKTNFIKPIKKILNLLYALLALSVIVSLVGIINTLVLTVYERTRELGMLRAVGMTRRQVRMMIRYESIVTALMGAALGIVVGVFLAALVTQALCRIRASSSRSRGCSSSTSCWPRSSSGILAAVIPARQGRPPERARGASVRVDSSVRGPA